MNFSKPSHDWVVLKTHRHLQTEQKKQEFQICACMLIGNQHLLRSDSRITHQFQPKVQFGSRVQVQKLQHFVIRERWMREHLALRQKHRYGESEAILVQIIQKQTAKQPLCQSGLTSLLVVNQISVAGFQVLKKASSQLALLVSKLKMSQT